MLNCYSVTATTILEARILLTATAAVSSTLYITSSAIHAVTGSRPIGPDTSNRMEHGPSSVHVHQLRQRYHNRMLPTSYVYIRPHRNLGEGNTIFWL